MRGGGSIRWSAGGVWVHRSIISNYADIRRGEGCERYSHI